MWEFVTVVLEKHGLASTIAIATVATSGFALKHLWSRNIELESLVSRATAEHRAELVQQQGEHAEFIAKLRAEHERSVREVRETMLEAAEGFADRMDMLHEKRNSEMRDVLREAVEHIADTRRSVDKITDAVQSLRDMLRR